jgi:hypothetical protein
MKWKYISSLKTRIYPQWFPNASAVTWSLVLQMRNLTKLKNSQSVMILVVRLAQLTDIIIYTSRTDTWHTNFPPYSFRHRFGSKPGSGIGTGKHLVIEGLWVRFILWWELWISEILYILLGPVTSQNKFCSCLILRLATREPKNQKYV